MKRTSKALFGTIFIFTALIGSSSAVHKSSLTHSSKNQTPIKISEKWIPKGYWSKRFVDPTREVCSSPRAHTVHTAEMTTTTRTIQCAYFQKIEIRRYRYWELWAFYSNYSKKWTGGFYHARQRSKLGDTKDTRIGKWQTR